jgi:hypothetical protein
MAKLKTILICTGVALLIAGIAVAYALNHREKPLWEVEVAFPSARISPSALQIFLTGDFTIVKDMKMLPPPVLQAYTERGGSRLVMANPGKRFNATDVIYDSSVPRKRLIFAGVSQDKCFVHYEQGGISHSYLVALFKVNSTKLEPVWKGYCGAAKNLEDLRSAVANEHCSGPGL